MHLAFGQMQHHTVNALLEKIIPTKLMMGCWVAYTVHYITKLPLYFLASCGESTLFTDYVIAILASNYTYTKPQTLRLMLEDLQ